jgi:adenosylcobinamide-phosphate synthase
MGRRSHVAQKSLGAAVGAVLDRLLGEPPASLHPVVNFGKLMARYERTNYHDSKSSGVTHAVIGTLLGISSGGALQSTTAATSLSVGGKMLTEVATDVQKALLNSDIENARGLMPTLVGRDPMTLDATEMSRAVVESVAENTVDAIVAPALWAALAGAPGAFGYRAINTMDAMVGHRSPRYANYGWASARLDDFANWIPARVTALLVALVRPRRAKAVLWAVLHQAPAHPSPNAGVVEAAFAAALGVELGGLNHYGEQPEDRPQLGTGPRVEPMDIARSVRLSNDVTSALISILGSIGLVAWFKSRCSPFHRHDRRDQWRPSRRSKNKIL